MYNIMFLVLFVVLITALLLWDYLSKRRRNQIYEANGYVGPSNLPLIGGAHHIMVNTPETILDTLTKYTRTFAKTYNIWLLHEAFLVVADAKLIEAVLTNQQVITKNSLYDLLKSWLGTGLLISTGKKWFTRRKIITPTFHFKILEQFVEVFDQQSTVLVEKLNEKANGLLAVNIFPMVCLTALDIITETAMGVKINAQNDPDFHYAKSVRTVAEIIAVRVLQPSQRFDITMRLCAPEEYATLQKNIVTMHNFTDNVIQERRALLEKSIAEGSYKMEEEEADVGTKKRMAFLDVLLQSTVAGSALTNEDIREEVDTFMFEGHDTTTSGISFALYLISRHPAVQEKLFREICDVMGNDKDKAITMRELQELKYMECVLKESMRLYPPVPQIGRYVEEDIMLNGKLMPAGTNIVILIYAALRDPDYFEDATSFKPERFSAESTAKIEPFLYIPFSAGPRNCVGQKFALLEMKATISKVLRHFELLPLGPDVRPLINIILRSANGVHLGLRPRNY